MSFSTIIVNFSAGRDSTAAALLARQQFPRARLILLFGAWADVEFPGYRDHVESAAAALGGDLHVIPLGSFGEYIPEKGWPLWLAPWCQGVLHAALDDWIRVRGLSLKNTLRITGSRVTQRARHAGLNPRKKIGSHALWCPVFYHTNYEIRRVLGETRLWPGYARGFKRTCCTTCPGQSASHYTLLRRLYPPSYKYLQSLIEAHGMFRPWNPVNRGPSLDWTEQTLDSLADSGCALIVRQFFRKSRGMRQQFLKKSNTYYESRTV